MLLYRDRSQERRIEREREGRERRKKIVVETRTLLMLEEAIIS